MQEVDVDIQLKILVVGNGACGKSSLLNQFTRGTINNIHQKTIGTEYYEKSIKLPGSDELIQLLLWDTAGQSVFSQVTQSYYHGTSAVILLFSTIDRDSFDSIESWYNRVSHAIQNENTIYVLVQNKIDLLHESVVTPAEVELLSRKLNIKLYRTCVKQNIHVNDIFMYVVDEYMVRGNNTNNNVIRSIDTYNINNHAVSTNTNNNTVNNENKNTNTMVEQPTKQHTRKSSVFDSYPSSVTPSQSNQRDRLQPVTQRTGGKKHTDCVLM